MKILAAAAGFALLSLSLQQQQPAAPTFKSSVDVVPVDVSVIDGDGRPVSDLTAADFNLTIDGKPRRLASAQFISLARHAEEAPEVPLSYSSNASALGGRLIAIAIDQANIRAGAGKRAIDAAQRFVAGLNKSDRVALYTIPGAGPLVDFTASRAVVQSLLGKVTGIATPEVGVRGLGVTEVFALDRGDQRVMTEIVDRECGSSRSIEEVNLCRRQIEIEAGEVLADVRTRTRDSIVGLRVLLERLALVPSPKTVVLVSEGLMLDRDVTQLSWVPALAARGQVSLYVLQILPPAIDSSNHRVSATREADIELARQGLGYLAGLARGEVYNVSGPADFAFSRILTELSGYYLLSFYPEAGDRGGQTHSIRVSVPGRSGVTIRARKEFVIDAAKKMTPEEVVAETLRSPLLATDVGVKVATYNFWDPAEQKIRIVIATELDRSMNPSGTLSLGYAIVGEKGALASTEFVPTLTNPVRDSRFQNYMAAAVVPRGLYSLKLGVVDDAGKKGSIEHTFNADVESAGQVRIGGPLLAARDNDTGPLRPAITGDFSSDVLHAYLELYSDAPEQLTNASVVVEVAQENVGRTLDSGAVTFQPQTDPRVRVGEASVTIALLPPGDYVVRAVINVFGRKAGQVVRPFRIVKKG
jgi:VWFA-related protein